MKNGLQVHELKTLPSYFQEVAEGNKPFEIRYNDRGFEKGDILVLREYTERFSGRTITAKVTYLTKFQQQPNHVVLGIKVLDVDHRLIR